MLEVILELQRLAAHAATAEEKKIWEKLLEKVDEENQGSVREVRTASE